MSNQEQKNQGETNKEAGVEKRRRFIKGAGIAAPVVLTLSSPSVFGIQCGSEIISGNESQGAAQGSCQPGQSPIYWGNPSHRSEWPSPYLYSVGPDPTIQNCSNFNGGTTFDGAFGTSPTRITGLTADNRPMREILCAGLPADELKRTLIAALLNGAIIPNTYPVNDLDVKAIQAGVAAVPTYPLEIPATEPHVIDFFTNYTW
jgi:hypothetical protein